MMVTRETYAKEPQYGGINQPINELGYWTLTDLSISAMTVLNPLHQNLYIEMPPSRKRTATTMMVLAFYHGDLPPGVQSGFERAPAVSRKRQSALGMMKLCARIVYLHHLLWHIPRIFCTSWKWREDGCIDVLPVKSSSGISGIKVSQTTWSSRVSESDGPMTASMRRCPSSQGALLSVVR